MLYCNLKNIRKIKKISQKEIADTLSIRQSTVSAWENNIAYPNIIIAFNLATYLNVGIDEIWIKKN